MIAVSAEDVELEVAHQVLGDNKHQLTDAQGLCKGLQVVVLGEPGCEITGFELPGLTRGTRSSLLKGGGLVMVRIGQAPAGNPRRSDRKVGGAEVDRGCGGGFG